MRLWINTEKFISVIKDDSEYSMQLMYLFHGKGMIDHQHETKRVKSIEEVFKYHENLIKMYNRRI